MLEVWFLCPLLKPMKSTLRNLESQPLINSFVLRLMRHLLTAIRHIDQPVVQMLITFFDKIQAKTGEEILFISNDLDDVVPVDEIDSSLQNLVIFDDFILSNNLNIVQEYYVRGRHQRCSTIFLTQIYLN